MLLCDAVMEFAALCRSHNVPAHITGAAQIADKVAAMVK